MQKSLAVDNEQSYEYGECIYDKKNVLSVQQEILDYEMKQMQGLKVIQDQLNILQGAVDTIDRLKFSKVNIIIDIELKCRKVLDNFGQYNNLHSQISDDIVVMQNT